MAREVIPEFADVLTEDGKLVPPAQPDAHLNMRDTSEALVYRLTLEEGTSPAGRRLADERLDRVLGNEANGALADRNTE